MSRLRALLHLLILAVLGVLPWMAWREHHANGSARPEVSATPPASRVAAGPGRPASGKHPLPTATRNAVSDSAAGLQVTSTPLAQAAPEPSPVVCSATTGTGGEAGPGCPSGP